MSVHQANGGRAWSIVALLFFYTTVNNFDKLVTGLAGVSIMREFTLSPSQYGAVAGSFYFLFAISGLLVGLFLVQRVSPKWLLMALVAIWTVAQLPMIFGASLGALYFGRILLGIGEGPATPSAYNALYYWFTNERRNMPTSVLIAGIGFAFLVGSPILAYLMAAYGWRAGFLVCGLIGIAWMVAWGLFGADGPLIDRQESTSWLEKPVSWTRFWSDGTVIGNVVIASTCYWISGLSFIWLGPYLQLGLGYSARDTGWLVSVILGSQIVVQVSLSFLSHRMLLSGFSSRVGRGLVSGGCVLASGSCLALATLVDQPVIAIVLLAAAFTLPQAVFVLAPAMVAEITPGPQRGTALLVIFSVMTVTGLIAPIVTGRVIQAAGASTLLGYTHALWLTAAILVVGGVSGLLFLNPEATRARFALEGVVGAPDAIPIDGGA